MGLVGPVASIAHRVVGLAQVEETPVGLTVFPVLGVVDGPVVFPAPGVAGRVFRVHHGAVDGRVVIIRRVVIVL